MYLKHKSTGDLVEVIDVAMLFDPCTLTLAGRLHAGEEMQDSATFNKSDLVFPSGEKLPRCWLDAHYREPLRNEA
jgi:hypothetical protein